MCWMTDAEGEPCVYKWAVNRQTVKHVNEPHGGSDLRKASTNAMDTPPKRKEVGSIPKGLRKYSWCTSAAISKGR
jgi:hypothetical protein